MKARARNLVKIFYLILASLAVQALLLFQTSLNSPYTCGRKTQKPNNISKSAGSGRKFLVRVIGLAMNKDLNRKTRFDKAWNLKWPEVYIEPQVSVLNHQSLRGYGLFVAYHSCLYDALQETATYDYLIIFEDDAVPFHKTTWPSLSANDLDIRLSILEEKRGSVLFLGGHDFRGYNSTSIDRSHPRGIIHATYGYGSYAVVIPRYEVSAYLESFASIITGKTNASSAPDLALWEIANARRKGGLTSGGYISVPLLVDHAPGFSHTWGKQRQRDFEESSTFWV